MPWSILKKPSSALCVFRQTVGAGFICRMNPLDKCGASCYDGFIKHKMCVLFKEDIMIKKLLAMLFAVLLMTGLILSAAAAGVVPEATLDEDTDISSIPLFKL